MFVVVMQWGYRGYWGSLKEYMLVWELWVFANMIWRYGNDYVPFCLW